MSRKFLAQKPFIANFIRLSTPSGHGSTNTTIRRFTATVESKGDAITYVDSAADGTTLTINEDGLYFLTYNDTYSGGSTAYGLSLNSTELTTGITSITAADILILTHNGVANQFGNCSIISFLKRGDIVRPHTLGTNDTTATTARLTIVKIG